MKHFFLLLLSSLSLGTVVLGQDYYTAFVGSFVEARPRDFAQIRSLGFLYERTGEGNLKQVFLGQYPKAAAAEQVVSALRAEGFTNAQALPGNYGQGTDVPVIQIATRYANKPLDWENLSSAGSLNVLLADGAIKVLTGTFPDVETAKAELARIRSLGFSDAFVKMVNSGRILPVTSIATGIKEELIPLTLNEGNTSPPSPPLDPTVTSAPAPEPADNPIVVNRPPTVPRPAPAGNPAAPAGTNPRGGVTEVAPVLEKPASTLPAIREAVKRNSVTELQKVLKQRGFYQSTLDGYYGGGTTAAYQRMSTQDFTVQKYRRLIPFYQNLAPTEKLNQLQLAIRELPYDPNAPLVIEGDQTAIGLAYQAYLSFTSLGPSPQVNQLMNEAVKAAYLNSGVSTSVFNYRATYAYQELDQLLLHLFYVHASPTVSYLLPCWFEARHPQAARGARQQMGDYARLLQQDDCGTFNAWPEVQLLSTIALDLNPVAHSQTTALQEAANRQNQLYTRTTPLPAAEATILETWQKHIMQQIDNWAGNDPLLLPTASALKMAYFQSQVRIEDHYMNLGLNETAARHLSIAALRAITGVPFRRFE